jgi:hypothetical protein
MKKSRLSIFDPKAIMKEMFKRDEIQNDFAVRRFCTEGDNTDSDEE